MHAVIVYESTYGNTRRIAEAVAEGVHDAAPEADVQCLEASATDGGMTRSADLLVVGGPTHLRGLSTRLSRRLAASSKIDKDDKDDDKVERRSSGPEPKVAGTGLRTWFHTLPAARAGARAAAFDTRGESRGSGGAADGIARRLARHHFDLVTEPRGFVVRDVAGPLREGELALAREWGRQLV
ncbi:flavodoxin domain-containing protein [Kitasatospora sp. NBC_00070]|uniref:flavodoxin domain-containing protein n=1 Tax=Kitasatospora sp. NBC_00070 TaxID=2975962 RepID=UPI003244168B